MAIATRKKKENELLSSVVHETAASAAVELLRNNGPFVLPEGNGWIVLALDAADIGGLCAKDNRDPDKGGLIQLISADEIQTLATGQMLDENFFGIIPNAQSLGRMSEYSLLTDASYAWAHVIEKDGDFTVNTVSPATYAEATEVEDGTLSLSELEGLATKLGLGSVSVEDASVTDADLEPATESIDVVNADSEPDFEGDPMFDVSPPIEVNESPLEDDWTPSADDVDDADENVMVYSEESADEVSFPADSEEYDDVDDDVLVADQSLVMDTLVRRFLTEDLDLGLDVGEFNQTFSLGVPMVHIEMPTGSSEWLGDQIGHLTRQANASLALLHDQNEERLRVSYVNLMSLHAEKVIHNVSTDRHGGRFEELLSFAQRVHSTKLAEKDEAIRAGKAELSERFEAEAKEASNQAAIDAEKRYKDRHRSRLSREQVEIAATIEASIEAAFDNDTQRILQLRRIDAENQMSEGTTRVVDVLRELHESNLHSEEQMLASCTAKIETLIADHRANDVSRVSVLAEDQARFNEVEVLNNQQTRLIDSMELEFQDRLRRSDAETDRVRAQGVAAVETRDREWQHEVELQKQRIAAADARADDFGGRMATVSETVRQNFEVQLADQTRLITTQQAELDNREASQKSWTRMMGFSMVAGFILAMLIGVVLGVFLI